MSPTALDPVASAAVITQAREGRTPRPLDFPAGLRPRDAAEAYAVQDAVVRARGPIAGWKVGAASPQAQPARAAMTRDSVWVPAAGGAAKARAMPGNASDATSWMASRLGSSTSFQA